jgi:predicted nucleic acid-binding Zn finger protein
MIGKIEKAHRYASEPERIRFDDLQATFHGGHDDYVVKLHGGEWSCSCHTFESHVVGSTCSHIMAMQRILGAMLDEASKFGAPEPVAAR